MFPPYQIVSIEARQIARKLTCGSTANYETPFEIGS